MKNIINSKLVIFLFLILLGVILIYINTGNDRYINVEFVNNIMKYKSLNNGPKRFVFFDLGANRGDTVYKFFKGEVIELKDKKEEKWIVHAFEPNSKFTKELIKMKEDIGKDYEINLYKETAAWIYDGKITFYVDTGSQFSEGTSILKEHPYVNKGQNFTVPCVDVAKLINSYDSNDYVVVKIDIEGAEYDLLMHFIKNNVLEKIDYLIIEYHKYLSKFKTPEDVFNSIFKLYNIEFKQWY